MKNILEYLTRGKSLNTILFVLVVAIIRELTALDSDGQLIAVLREIQGQDISTLKNNIISIVIAFVSGGSYITLGILSLIFLIVCFLKYNERKNVQIPSISVEFKYRANQKSNEGISSLNKPNQEGNIILNPVTALYVFKFIWEYDLTIRNNSSFYAYKPKIYFLKKFDKIDRVNYLNINEPIKPNESIQLQYKYEFLKDVNGKESMKILNERYPPLIKDFEMLIEFENEKGKKFYNLYKQDTRTNSKLKRKKKPYKGIEYDKKIESDRVFLV